MREKGEIAGFSLIELVMVIVIIGILAAIAIPKFFDLRADAARAACSGNIQSIQTALNTYYARSVLDGNASFPSDSGTTRADFAANYFAAGTIPVCPVTSQAYTWNSSNGVV